MSSRTANLIGCVLVVATFALQPLSAGQGASGSAGQKGKPGTTAAFATFSVLPSLGSNSVAHAIDEAGTVIVGQAFDRDGLLHAVKWTMQNGSWVIAELPWPADAISATARGVNNQGDAAGNDFQRPGSRPILWPSGDGPTILGCPSDSGLATVYGISALGQVAIGNLGGAAVWRPGFCRESLPPLFEEGGTGAFAVNGDGTIVGGIATLTEGDGAGHPVRWRNVGAQWSIELLDGQNGAVRGANSAGDLAGYISFPCGSDNDCQRAMIWYAAGGFRQLDTLGGDYSVAYDVNASGEVVGMSSPPRGDSIPFFWSQSVGMVQLPIKRGFALVRAMSNVRADGTRLVVGESSVTSGSKATVWVVRNP